MKNEMIALADYIESESRNNLAAHTTHHYQIKEAYSQGKNALCEFVQFHDMPDLQTKIKVRESELKSTGEHSARRSALKAIIKRGKEILKCETISSIYRVNHAEFKLSDAVDTTSNYSVMCKPEVEACNALAAKIRKNAGKSFETRKRFGYTPTKPAGSLKMALRNLMADKDWAACANLALPQGTPLYVQLKGNNEPLGLYEFVQDHPERNEYVIVKNHVNHVLLSRYYALPLLSGDSAKAVIKQMDDYMQKRKLSWSDVEDQIIRKKPVRHEVALEQLCKNQGQPIDYQALWPTAKAGIKVESPKPKVVKAAKSAPAKPKAKAVSKPVVTSALLMQALAAIPKNYHV